MVEPQGNFPVLTCVPLLVHWVDTVVKGFALPRVSVCVCVCVCVCVSSPVRHGTAFYILNVELRLFRHLV